MPALLSVYANRAGSLRDTAAVKWFPRRPVRDARQLDEFLVGDGLDVATVTCDLHALTENLDEFSGGSPSSRRRLSSSPHGKVGTQLRKPRESRAVALLHRSSTRNPLAPIQQQQLGNIESSAERQTGHHQHEASAVDSNLGARRRGHRPYSLCRHDLVVDPHRAARQNDVAAAVTAVRTYSADRIHATAYALHMDTSTTIDSDATAAEALARITPWSTRITSRPPFFADSLTRPEILIANLKAMARHGGFAAGDREGATSHAGLWRLLSQGEPDSGGYAYNLANSEQNLWELSVREEGYAAASERSEDAICMPARRVVSEGRQARQPRARGRPRTGAYESRQFLRPPGSGDRCPRLLARDTRAQTRFAMAHGRDRHLPSGSFAGHGRTCPARSCGIAGRPGIGRWRTLSRF